MTVRSFRRSVAAVVGGALVGTMLLAAPADAAPPDEKMLAEFTKGVKPKNLLKHLERLQRQRWKPRERPAWVRRVLPVACSPEPRA